MCHVYLHFFHDTSVNSNYCSYSILAHFVKFEKKNRRGGTWDYNGQFFVKTQILISFLVNPNTSCERHVVGISDKIDILWVLGQL